MNLWGKVPKESISIVFEGSVTRHPVVPSDEDKGPLLVEPLTKLSHYLELLRTVSPVTVYYSKEDKEITIQFGYDRPDHVEWPDDVTDEDEDEEN